MDRRKFLQNSSLATAAVSIGPFAFAKKKKPSSFHVGFLSDTHVKPTDTAEEGMRKAFRHVNRSEPKVDFIINGGDSIMDALNATKEKVQKQWDVWNKVISEENKLTVPSLHRQP